MSKFDREDYEVIRMVRQNRLRMEAAQNAMYELLEDEPAEESRVGRFLVPVLLGLLGLAVLAAML